jgi:hypothetical protein
MSRPIGEKAQKMANFTAFEDTNAFVYGIEYPPSNKFVDPDEWAQINEINRQSFLREPLIVIPLDQVEMMEDEDIAGFVRGASDRAHFVFALQAARQLIAQPNAAYERVKSYGIETSKTVLGMLRKYAGESSVIAAAADDLGIAISARETELNAAPAISETPAATAPKWAGHIYVVESAGYYKIGMAKIVARRVYQFSTEYPHPVTLVMSAPVENMREAEASLHARFADKRVRGEWFTLTAEDLETIREELGING